MSQFFQDQLRSFLEKSGSEIGDVFPRILKVRVNAKPFTIIFFEDGLTVSAYTHKGVIDNFYDYSDPDFQEDLLDWMLSQNLGT